MAAPAYAFERFAPRKKEAQQPDIRVAPGAARKRARQKALLRARLRLLGVMVGAIFFVGLTAALLHTQSSMAALQIEISTQQKELVDQHALGVYLKYELESKTNLKEIEERAIEMGMMKKEQDQIVYMQNRQDNSITVSDSAISRFLSSISGGVLSVVDYLTE